VPSGGKGVRPVWARLLPEMLRPLGYRSYLSGKWHVDGKPTENGFDHSYVLEDHNRNFNPQKHSEDDQQLPPVKPGSGYYTSTADADHAIKCLKEHAEKFPDKPFFEYLAFTVPHFPLQAPAENIARYKGKYSAGWNAIAQSRWERMSKFGIVHQALPPMERQLGPPYDFPEDLAKLGAGEINRPLPWNELTDAQRKFQADKMSVHAAMVDRMDQEIGRVLAQLKAMGALDNTLIFFLSDNGASAELMVRGDGNDPNAAPGSAGSFLCLGPGWSSAANTPLRRHKTWVHEGGISTPLVVHWPKGIAARGELRHNPGHLVDLVPTILEVAGGKPVATWEGKPVPPAPGRSLVPAFKKDGTVPHDYLWWLHENNRAIRVGDWKLVADAKGSWELYDLGNDRGESQNLVARYPDKAKELEALWNKHTEEFRSLAAKDAPKDDAPKKGGKKKAKAKTADAQ
jgi:arylsulfatase